MILKFDNQYAIRSGLFIPMGYLIYEWQCEYKYHLPVSKTFHTALYMMKYCYFFLFQDVKVPKILTYSRSEHHEGKQALLYPSKHAAADDLETLLR